MSAITETDIENVQKSWKVFVADWKKIGIQFFMKLFVDHPDILTFFRTFDDMSLPEIEKSTKLRAHAINFRHSVTSYLENLGDLDTAVILIQKTAASHFKRQIRADQFKIALDCFLKLIKESNKAEPETVESWDKVLTVVHQVIEAHMNKLVEETDGE